MSATLSPSRPRTAGVPNLLSSDSSDRWSVDSDDDPGMFSFLPPSSNSPPHRESFLVPVQDASRDTSNPPANPAQQLTPNYSHHPLLQTPPDTASLSPAAAYARAAQRHLGADGGWVQGARRRGSWQVPDTPTHLVSESIREQQDRLFMAESKLVSFEALGTVRTGETGLSTSTGGRSEYDTEMRDLGSKSSGERENPYKYGGGDESGEESGTAANLSYFDGAEEDSPFAEVRASVSNLDDPEMPCLTFRSMFLGLFFCVVFGAINCFFYLSPPVVQVLSYPLGKLLAAILPTTSWRVPKFLRLFGAPDDLSLNPGPFNIKEHTVVIIMVNCSIAPAYALNYSITSELWYGKTPSYLFDLLFLLSTQMVGFGTAGVARRFLVWPAGLIWPQNLVFCTLFNTLHAEDDGDEGDTGLSRFRFFGYVCGGAFVWYFLPGFLFQALSVFSFVCWAAPKNAVVNQLFGLSTGLGMGLLTFDWLQIAYIGSPLVVPFWSEVNVLIGFVVAYWVVTPILFYTNVWNTAYLPISASQVYDRFGEAYNITRVLDKVSLQLNVTAYHEYSPLYLPMTFATVYGLAFALATALLTHTALYHGKDMWRQAMRPSNPIDEDVHSRLMRSYPEVPDWWYYSFVIVFSSLAIIAMTAWDDLIPIWALLVSLLVGFIYVIPGGFVYAMTSQQISINLIVELIAGYALPGNAVSNMLFKVYSVQPQNISMQFVQDLKLGHYMKIPPRVTFKVQIIASFFATLVQIGIKQWLMTFPKICQPDNPHLLVCPITTVFYSASIIWGLIGPARQFGPGSIYRPLLWWLLAGAIFPVLGWLAARRWPTSGLRYLNVPVLITGATFVPPATGINYSSWFLFGFVFQYWGRKHYFRWWSKFNFVLSAGLDIGTAVSTLVIFFALQLPKGGTIALNWWGNNIFTQTADWNGVPYRTPPAEGFGPSTWM